MPLTALQVKNAAPRERDYGLADGSGLFLWIRAVGGKSWRFRFRLDGKQSHISLGTIDKVTLAQARQLASEARQFVAQGRHPGLERKVARAQAAISRANTFKSLALEWHQHNWTKNHHEQSFATTHHQYWLDSSACDKTLPPGDVSTSQYTSCHPLPVQADHEKPGIKNNQSIAHFPLIDCNYLDSH